MRLCVLLCASTLFISYNVVKAQPQHGYRITFADKRGTKNFDQPTDLLSQRALDRRTAQGIALDSLDLPVSSLYKDSVLALTGGKLHLTSRWFNYCVILLNDSSKIHALDGQAFVASIEYVAYHSAGLHKMSAEAVNEKFKSESVVIANDQNKGTGTESFYGATWGQTRVVNGDYLHDRGYMGQGKLIAVCDEGFSFVDANPGFDSLRRSGRLVDTYNFVKATANVYQEGTHGTSSLSTMAAYLPGSYVGAAPLAQYALYTTEYRDGEQPMELDNYVAAMERADSIGADIITGSIGYNAFDRPSPYQLEYQDINGHSTLVARGANIATSKGILFVASAGNDGLTPWKYVLTPGDADSAMTVGSVDINKNIAANSGYGPNSSGRTKPDVCLVGQPAAILNSSEVPTVAAGTSFATPQLAGWAACLWQATSKANPNRIRNAITQSASLYSRPDVHYGYGVPDFGRAVELLDVKDTPALPSNWISIHTNPIKDDLRIHLNQTHTGNVAMVVTDISGRVVSREERRIVVGNHTLLLPGSHLSPGLYFFAISSDNRKAVLKFVKN
ncbi:MAG: T9SS type A sorting domain-containing protein [Sphingobacteriales bacterium]|nr:MAG: T9SS type A sorting domain-containing protein [Sphingobacteriales bacterium]